MKYKIKKFNEYNESLKTFFLMLPLFVELNLINMPKDNQESINVAKSLEKKLVYDDRIKLAYFLALNLREGGLIKDTEEKIKNKWDEVKFEYYDDYVKAPSWDWMKKKYLNDEMKFKKKLLPFELMNETPPYENKSKNNGSVKTIFKKGNVITEIDPINRSFSVGTTVPIGKFFIKKN